MIDDMSYHVTAWHDILTNDLRSSLSIAQVKEQMYGKNDELLVRVFGKRKFSYNRMKEISLEKERRYQEAYLPHLALINGLEAFLAAAADKSVSMAIGSAAIPFNIDFVLDNLHIRHYFSAIVSADDVPVSKPDPETFLLAARRLDTPPNNCLVFEDAPKGVEAAARAGMDVMVLTTMHPAAEFAGFTNIIGFVQDFTDPAVSRLLS